LPESILDAAKNVGKQAGSLGGNVFPDGACRPWLALAKPFQRDQIR